MTPEGAIQAHLKRRVKETGGEFRKLRWIGRRGAADCFIWWPGPRFAFVEVKQPKGRLSVLQEREIETLKRAGFAVHVVWSKDDVDALIHHLTV